MSAAASVLAVERLRALRVRPAPDLGIADAIADARARIRSRRRAADDVESAWTSVIPERLACRCRVMHLRGGVLTVWARDASARFELDRFLRCGGEDAIRRAAGRPISRVRITL